MPGMAASPNIFEYIKLPENRFEVHLLSWKIPHPNESLTDYAKRYLVDIKEDKPVLLGISFGGVLVQEIAKLLACHKVIIVSSVKSKYELPRRMKYSRRLGLYHVAPVRIMQKVDILAKYAPNKWAKNKLELYQKYLSVNDPTYLSWALREMICWDQEQPAKGIIHIHGNEDPVFPHKYIGDCITIPGGSHIMIITKCKWFNENLPKLIE